jgi:hypothetical protein
MIRLDRILARVIEWELLSVEGEKKRRRRKRAILKMNMRKCHYNQVTAF